MDEKQNQPFQFLFNASLKGDFQGSRVTSDGDLILVREMDERLGLVMLIDEHLSDSRQCSNRSGLSRQFRRIEALASRRGSIFPGATAWRCALSQEISRYRAQLLRVLAEIRD